MSIRNSSKSDKGTTIYVPKELRDRIRELSNKYGKPQWKILLDALALYETSIRKARTKEELPVVDKVVWYIEKLSMSIGALKENPSDTNLQKTLKTLKQVKERLDVDIRLLERAVNDYVSLTKKLGSDAVELHESLDEATMELNMALKSVLIEIVYKYILKEEITSQSVSQASQA
jgi:hypothetical protein